MKRVIQIQQVSDLLKATHLESGRARTWTHAWELVVLTIPHYCLGQSPGVSFWLVLPECFSTTFCTLMIPRGWDSISYKETLQLGSSWTSRSFSFQYQGERNPVPDSGGSKRPPITR